MTLVSLISDYWPSLAAFAAFGLLHSVGAQEPLKNQLAGWTGDFFVEHFWRLVYCALSLAALYYGVSTLHWARNVDYDIWLIDYPDWLWQLLTVLHLLSVALLYAAFLQSDYLEFLGFRQAWRGVLALLGPPSRRPEIRLFGTHRLVVGGLYAWVRHPMMAAGLLFLLTSGPSLNNLVYTGMYATYMVIGGYYEERRMIRLFGADYLRYRSRVGAFFPRLWPPAME